MAKTKEELNAIAKEVHDLANKFQSLTDEELEEVTGGKFEGYINDLSSYDLKNLGMEEAFLPFLARLIYGFHNQDEATKRP